MLYLCPQVMLLLLDHGRCLLRLDPCWFFISSIEQSVQVLHPHFIPRGRNIRYVKGTLLLSFALMIMQFAWNSTSFAPICLLHLQVFLVDILKTIYISYFMLSEMAHKLLFLMEMQVIVGFGSRNSPCSLKHGLRSLELEFNLGDMIQFRCLFDINVGQMRELGWLSNCCFFQSLMVRHSG